MKKLLYCLTIITASFTSSIAQKVAYNSDGKTIKYTTEESVIEFLNPINFAGHQLAPLAATLIPTAVDLGIKIATNALEKRVKKFSGEYVDKSSVLELSDSGIPPVVFERKVDGKPAFRVEMMPHPVTVSDEVIGFVFLIEGIELNKSKAKVLKGDRLDYTIELKPTILVKGEKKALDLFPMTVTSVAFGANEYKKQEHKSDIILLPIGAVLTEMQIKIVETNPRKIKAESIVAVLSSYKDDAKTIVNNIIEANGESKSDDKKGTPNSGTPENAGSNATDPDSSVSSSPAK